MFRSLTAFPALVAMLVLAACTADAGVEQVGTDTAPIVSGSPDGTAHPATGAIVSFRASVNAVGARCSGALVAPTVFLTAAHCSPAAPGGRAEITFDSKFVAGTSPTFVGQFIAHPGFDQNQADPHDIAVVIFPSAIPGITPVKLPSANSLGNLVGGQQFTSVGYGIQSIVPGAGTTAQDQGRWKAVGTLNATNPSWLRLSQNAATGNGGTCYGDSGGPNFLGAGGSETAIEAGITITGDSNCKSTNVIYRLDTASARSFLASYVTLP